MTWSNYLDVRAQLEGAGLVLKDELSDVRGALVAGLPAAMMMLQSGWRV